MGFHRVGAGLCAGLAMLLAGLIGDPARAQGTAAVSGTVTAEGEGALEGVLVSVKKTGSPFTITVVSDKDGKYSFPAGRLEAGTYILRVRAIGYLLPGRVNATIAAGKPQSVDLKLKPTSQIAAQMSNAEWIASMPGSDADKKFLLNCVGCHTLERPILSRYNADQFMPLLSRMAGYAQASTPLHPQRRIEKLPTEPGQEQRDRKQAEFLSKINLSGGEAWSYPLKALPRITGRGTRVIVTEYDLPRPTSQAHDVIVDEAGIVWYSNFGEPFISRLDPKTGKVKEYTVPVLKPKSPIGMLDLHPDSEGNLWFGYMYQGAIGRFDKKTEKLDVFPLPAEMNGDRAQVNMVDATHSAVDGKVWANNNGHAALHRYDLKTGKWEFFEPFKDIGGVAKHNLYTVRTDKQNNAYFTDLNSELMGRMDAKTLEVKWYKLPTAGAGTRRGMMDNEERFWVGEFKGDKIGMLDTRTGAFKEWNVPTPWTNPYDVAVDKNGELWTASMLTDRVVRLDPKTGAATEYPLPHETNVRRVFVDNRTSPVSFWVGNNHGATVVKVEPLD